MQNRAPYDDRPRPHLILLDLNLPTISGLELLSQLKADSSLFLLPVVVLSGSEAPNDVRRSFMHGANAYLVKPGSSERAKQLADAVVSFWFDLGRVPEGI